MHPKDTRWTGVVRLGVALAGMVAVGVAAAPGQVASAKKHRAARPASGAAPVNAPKEALLAATDEILRQVSALRGLPAKAQLARGVLSRDEIGAKLKQRIAKEYTPEEVQSESRVLKRLGLLPPQADYEKLILDLLMEQVAGFYDPFAARLYIADWLPLEMQRPALAHEIEHALQDQYFDLKRFAEPIKDNGDQQLAHSALVEGDGTAVMLEFEAHAMGLPLEQLPTLVAQLGKQMLTASGQTPLFDQAPRFLRETLIFPYLDGLKFIEAIRQSAPWSKVNEAFQTPPESTEQVMHPKKFFAREHPQKVQTAPLSSLQGKKLLRQDVLGELEWRILFASQLSDAVASAAAEGWGGDCLVAYADDSPATLPVVIDLAVWDTETDAREAAEAADKLLAHLAGQKPAPGGSYIDARGEAWAVERHGDQILVLFGVPATALKAVSAEVWRSWKVVKSPVTP